MSLDPGTKLGPYEILSPLGSGGMGQVYRARDTRLQREVAMKVLSSSLLSDEQARAVLAKLLEKRKTQFLPPTQIALIYGGLGERDTAFAWLERSFEDKAWLIDEMNVDPLFDVFKGDARFDELIRKMNYPPAR